MILKGLVIDQKKQNQWSRSCQNSGTKKTTNQQYVYSSLDELLKKGYKFNEKTKYYEKELKLTKKVVLRKKVIIKA